MIPRSLYFFFDRGRNYFRALTPRTAKEREKEITIVPEIEFFQDSIYDYTIEFHRVFNSF